MNLDREERICRYLDAMDSLHDLVSSRHPHLSINPGNLAQLIGLLNEEGRKVIPLQVSPFLANDDMIEDDG